MRSSAGPGPPAAAPQRGPGRRPPRPAPSRAAPPGPRRTPVRGPAGRQSGRGRRVHFRAPTTLPTASAGGRSGGRALSWYHEQIRSQTRRLALTGSQSTAPSSSSPARHANIEGVLVVDAANVIGSKPNGWWPDQPGAARQSVEQLRDAGRHGRIPLPAVVVLEGAAAPASLRQTLTACASSTLPTSATKLWWRRLRRRPAESTTCTGGQTGGALQRPPGRGPAVLPGRRRCPSRRHQGTGGPL